MTPASTPSLPQSGHASLRALALAAAVVAVARWEGELKPTTISD